MQSFQRRRPRHSVDYKREFPQYRYAEYSVVASVKDGGDSTGAFRTRMHASGLDSIANDCSGDSLGDPKIRATLT
jgi:hypothetical protein